MVAHFCNPSNETAKLKLKQEIGMSSRPACDTEGMGRRGKGNGKGRKRGGKYKGKGRKNKQEGNKEVTLHEEPLPHLGAAHFLELCLGFLCSVCFSFSQPLCLSLH